MSFMTYEQLMEAKLRNKAKGVNREEIITADDFKEDGVTLKKPGWSPADAEFIRKEKAKRKSKGLRGDMARDREKAREALKGLFR